MVDSRKVAVDSPSCKVAGNARALKVRATRQMYQNPGKSLEQAAIGSYHFRGSVFGRETGVAAPMRAVSSAIEGTLFT